MGVLDFVTDSGVYVIYTVCGNGGVLALVMTCSTPVSFELNVLGRCMTESERVM